MQDSRSNIVYIIGSVIFVFLQIFLSPLIAINNITPNFIFIFTIVCSIVRFNKPSLFFIFILGMINDFFTSGLIGSASFSLVLTIFVITNLMKTLSRTNFLITGVSIFLSCFLSELIYGLLQIFILMESSFIDMIAYIIIPCCFYNFIVSLLLFPIIKRLIKGPKIAKQSVANSSINDLYQ